MLPAFALLDDCGATPERPMSRLLTELVRDHRCVDPADLDATWARVDADLRQGLHAVLLADYEWGAKLQRAGQARLAADDGAALRVLMFRDCVRLSADAVASWLEGVEQGAGPPQPVGVMDLQPSIDEAAFSGAIARIHEAIAAGETYQVNFTFRLRGQCYGDPVALYRRLRARQPVAYGALIALPGPSEQGEAEASYVLSRSPELFLRHDAGVLTARPMKGTATRVAAPEADSEMARRLALDAKNRAENVMIVDLLRNDIGRVAQVGSVQVPTLFAIEPYATLFQMTSTVQATLRADVAMPELLRAVFPCGSITGAPKQHTMDWISALESTPRGLYCGAIGWVDAPADGTLVGDFCLSVAIRTLTLGEESKGQRRLRLGIGAGIVQDSVAADEFKECWLKARFLTGLDPGFELFETMLATPGAGIHHLERHLARLAHSARVLGFTFDRDAALLALREALPALAAGQPSRLRLALAHSGRIAITHAALSPLPEGAVQLVIADTALPNANPLAAHKTTVRQHYDAGVRAAEALGAFDSLFFTEDGRLAEGGRSTVFARIAGHWYTPPVADGALPGVLRSVLLDDPAWAATERSLYRHELLAAEQIVVCNALRGVLPATLAP